MNDAAKLLRENLVLDENGKEALIKIDGKENIDLVIRWLDKVRVDGLGLSTRSYNCLYRYFDRPYSVDELVSLAENNLLDKVKYLGKKGKKDVLDALAKNDLMISTVPIAEEQPEDTASS